jgi:hypothetical protein
VRDLWRRPLRIEVQGWRRPVGLIAHGLPIAMVVMGLTIAIASAVLEERPGSDPFTTLGVEAGGALWLGGAVILGANRDTRLVEGLLLVALALGGATLITLALVLDWSGAPLTLAMEFGVSALAVVVLDVALIGMLHPRIERFASDPDEGTVTVRLVRSWHLVDVELRRPREEPQRFE